VGGKRCIETDSGTSVVVVDIGHCVHTFSIDHHRCKYPYVCYWYNNIYNIYNDDESFIKHIGCNNNNNNNNDDDHDVSITSDLNDGDDDDYDVESAKAGRDNHDDASSANRTESNRCRIDILVAIIIVVVLIIIDYSTTSNKHYDDGSDDDIVGVIGVDIARAVGDDNERNGERAVDRHARLVVAHRQLDRTRHVRSHRSAKHVTAIVCTLVLRSC
jgi:hypothetical protein